MSEAAAPLTRLTAEDMQRIVESLPGPYVHERSTKLGPGWQSSDRFLVTCFPSSLGPDPRARFAEIARALACPPVAVERLLYRWDRVESVHLGCDGIDPPLFKLYVEYPPGRSGRSDIPPETGFLAAKWRPGGALGYSLYRVLPEPATAPAARTALLGATTDDVGPASLRFADAVLAGILMPDAPVAILVVEDETSPRRSFDINLYRAETPLARHRTAIRDLCAAFGLPDAARAILADGEGSMLVHVAIGRDDKGAEFVTLYYGVTARDGVRDPTR